MRSASPIWSSRSTAGAPERGGIGTSYFLQLTFDGLALGAVYALVALGFVIIYKATEVINFAHGELILLAAYLIYAFNNEASLPFAVAVVAALAIMALLGFLVERTVLRRMVGRPVFAVVMITIGMSIIIRQVVTARWGAENRFLGEPWAGDTLRLADVTLTVGSVITILATAGVLALFFVFFRYSSAGVAMRATAFDQEAALAIGIPVRRVYAWSWIMGAAIATVGGLFLARAPQTLTPALGFVALRAFPAAILGGLDSPAGAVVGGLAIGLIEVLTQGYQQDVAPWLGHGFYTVAPYVVMILVLMVRPYGLFGTKEVERV